MSIDANSQAARAFYRMVRDFALGVKPWEEAIYHDVLPDERWDVTLVSARVYGRRDEYMAVMAAAGLDGVDQPLEQRRLVLPTESRLRQLKMASGFESRARYREDGKPTWSTD